MKRYSAVMTGKPSEAVVDAWIALMRAQHTAMSRIERAFRDAGLPPHAWYDALWELDRTEREGLRPYEIERRMLVAQSNVSRLIDRLEARGLAERRPCEGDGRGQIVAITQAGRDLRRRMWPVYAAAIEAAVGAPLDAEEPEQLTRILAKLVPTDGGK
jgi:DNA-binding MarR family transcriptional regulator